MNLLITDAPNIQTLTVHSTIQEFTIVTTPSSEPVTKSPKETPALATATNATSNMPFTSTVPPAVAITPDKLSDVSRGDTHQNACLNVRRSETTISPAVHEILKLPVAKATSCKPERKRLVLPKAISGKTFHDLLEKRQKEKEEEIERKEMRKKEREQTRKRKEEEKQRKEKERTEKKI
jgi:chromatin assembly factor 1 subunit A